MVLRKASKGDVEVFVVLKEVDGRPLGGFLEFIRFILDEAVCGVGPLPH
jgi:hypothetical protein